MNIKKILKYVSTLVLALSLVFGLIPMSLFTKEAKATETNVGSIEIDGKDYDLFSGFERIERSDNYYCEEDHASNNFPGDFLIDNNTGTRWINECLETPDEFPYVSFYTDKPIIPKGFILRTGVFGGDMPQSWTLKAKTNENDAWDVLYSSSSDDILNNNSNNFFSCINNQNKEYHYFYFEMHKQALGDEDLVELCELQLYGYACTHIYEKEASCTEYGYSKECYYKDGKYFEDLDDFKELNESEVRIPMIAHSCTHYNETNTTIEYWYCTSCQKYFSDSDYNTEVHQEDITKSFSVTLPENMIVCDSTTEPDDEGKYVSGTVIVFKPKFPYNASNVSDGTNILYEDDDNSYSITIDKDIVITADFNRSSYLDLDYAYNDFVCIDGDVLYGSTIHSAIIKNDSNIILKNATIEGAITCEGNATITLVGTNNISSNVYGHAGIEIGPENTTLTIKGNGILNVTGNDEGGAGIGTSLVDNHNGGNIVIEGGEIIAEGGLESAAIGTASAFLYDQSIGNISIKGGSITAIGGSFYDYGDPEDVPEDDWEDDWEDDDCDEDYEDYEDEGDLEDNNEGSSLDQKNDGIGKGLVDWNNTIGSISIYDNVVLINSTGITDFDNVVFMHGDTNVTVNKSEYFNVDNNGSNYTITPKGPIFTKHALLLSGDIGVKFRVAFPENFDAEGCYVDFVSSDGRSATMLYSDAQVIEDSNDRFFTFNINAIELADTITATLHYGEGYKRVNEYSAMMYIDSVLYDNASEELLKIIDALYMYGYYMQHSGWGDDSNDHVEIAEPSFLFSERDINYWKDYISEYINTVEVNESGISDVKIYLTLNSRTVINILVSLEEGTTMVSEGYTTRQITNSENEDITYYQFTSEQIGPAALADDKIFNIETSNGTAVIKASAMGYVNMLLKIDGLTDAQKYALASYIYYFCESSYN